MKNSGSEIAASEMTLMTLSGMRLRKCTGQHAEARSPAGSRSAPRRQARNSELPRRLPICSLTEFLLAQDVPKSPWTASPSHSEVARRHRAG